jgi:hypothetical protein
MHFFGLRYVSIQNFKQRPIDLPSIYMAINNLLPGFELILTGQKQFKILRLLKLGIKYIILPGLVALNFLKMLLVLESSVKRPEKNQGP